MKKWILRILLVLVFLVVIVVVAIGLSLNSAIKKGVETFGPQIAKVDVKLASVNLSLLSGSGSVNGLVIGNPEGYKLPHAISVGNTSVAISPGSMLSDKVVVKFIHIEAPEIAFELGPGGSNLQKIQANIGSRVDSGKPAAKPDAKKKPGKKLQVDEVMITGGRISLDTSVLGGKLSEAALPEIRLTNLGSGPDGITASDLGVRVLSAVMDGAIKVSGDVLAKAGKEALNKAADDAAGKAAKGIGDLLNKKKQ